ncbi:MAG: hypothetical protein IJR85_01905 [Synergistaceae bacterium]|nr:hypothetical protein [Synergistaceae bacterium]
MFTETSTFREILDAPAFRDYSRYFLGNCNIPDVNLSLHEMQKLFDDWEPGTIIYGLNYLESAIAK